MVRTDSPVHAPHCDSCSHGAAGAAEHLISALERLVEGTGCPLTLHVIPHDVGGSSLFALSLASPAGTAPTPAIATASAVAPGQGIAPAPLTVRQREILSMAASGLTNAQIARRLHVAISTVERHCTMAYRAMGVRNRAEALVAFYNPAAA